MTNPSSVSEELHDAIAAIVGYTYGTNVVKSPGELTAMLFEKVQPFIARLKAEGLREAQEIIDESISYSEAYDKIVARAAALSPETKVEAP